MSTLEYGSLDYEELQRICNYRYVRKTLKPAGIGSIIFGVIAIVMGFTGIADNPINAILGFIGLFLFVEGIWIIFAPKPMGMIVDGIALSILGVWNIMVTIANAANGESHGFFAILGLMQIAMAVQSFKMYKRCSVMPMVIPTEETLKKLDELAKSIAKSEVKDQPDMIEFQIIGFRNRQIWKGKLESDSAIFAEGSGQDVIFAKKNEVELVNNGKVMVGKSLNMQFKTKDRILKGTIKPESFDRFTAWKTKPIPGTIPIVN
ncbi:MAG: hypothetical protein ACE14V_10200 [bacterium]